MPSKREIDLEQRLKDIINDFDQTGCSPGLGTVSTGAINQARVALDMETLEDEEDSEGEDTDEAPTEQGEHCIDCDVSFEDYPEMKTGGPKCTTCTDEPEEDLSDSHPEDESTP